MLTVIGRRALPCVAVALALSAGLNAPRAVAEGTISVSGSGTATEYRDAVDRLVSAIEADVSLAARATHDTPALYLDLNDSLDRVPDFGSLAAGDQALLRAAKQTYGLYRALGGELLDRLAMLQRQNNRYYIAVDGEGGRWATTVEGALAILLEELATIDAHRDAIETAVSRCPHDFHCVLRATFMGMIESIAHVPHDSTVTLEMTGDGFRGDDGPPVVLAPEGFVVHEVAYDGGDKIVATVSVPESAPLGVNVISVYNEGHAFRSAEDYGVEVVANPDELAALVSDAAPGASSTERSDPFVDAGGFRPLLDDHSADKASATPLSGAASGRLGSADDADLFKIVVEEAGTLSVTSDGPTDVVATLESEDGSVIATDDDAGARYNFKLERAVVPGIYYLRVTHCCAGRGDYRLSSSLAPNN